MELRDQLQEGIASLKEHIDETVMAKLTAKDGEVAALTERIKALEEGKAALEEKLKAAENLYLPGVESAHKTGNPHDFMWGRFVKIVADPENKKHLWDEKDCAYELDVRKEGEKLFEGLDSVMKTAINAATGAGGAFLIPTELQRELIEVLEARSIAMKLGVQSINGLSGDLQWTKNEGGITAGYIDTETEASGSESTPTFSAITLRPHVMGAFVPMTWGMLAQPALSIDNWVRTRIGVKLALLEDNSIFQGTGAQGQPLGITNVSGINTMNWSTAPGTPNFSGANQNITRGLRLHVKDLMDNDAFEGAERLGWAMSPSALWAISVTRDGDGKDLFYNAIAPGSQALPREILGYPAFSSSQLEQSGNTAEFLLFGDFAQVMNGHWGVMAFASSTETETNFRKLRTTVRGVWAHDVGVMQAAAFSNSANFNVAAALT